MVYGERSLADVVTREGEERWVVMGEPIIRKVVKIVYNGEYIKEQVKQLQTSEFSISFMQITRNINKIRDHMVEFLVKHKLINTSLHGS